jgi:hypothetical protein
MHTYIHTYTHIIVSSQPLCFFRLWHLLDVALRSSSSYDSGSPIIIPGGDEATGQDLLVALVSWGVRCADPDFPGT